MWVITAVNTMTMEGLSFRSIPAFRELILWGNSFPMHEIITSNKEGSDVLFGTEDFRRERERIIKGKKSRKWFCDAPFCT